jgi:LysR family transcriptional activator of mexEF-oprN operon
MRIVVVPVHFRNVAEALASRVDLAVSVADDLPQDIRRQALFTGGFVCVYDPRHAEIGRTLTRARYLAHEHVIVSYNGDLRGLVEDLLGVRRNVRVSVASFQSVGAIVEGTAMLATVPALVAREILRVRRGLRAIALPFALAGTATELLWRRALDDDDAVGFVRGHVVAVATEASAAASAQGASTP